MTTLLPFVIGGIATVGFAVTADHLVADGFAPLVAAFLSAVAWWPLAFGLFYVLTTTGVVA